jgi:presenilin-like A22 family membrane protease
MDGSMTRLQEVAATVIQLAVIAIAIAVPILVLCPSRWWRSEVAGRTMFDALVAIGRRVLRF